MSNLSAKFRTAAASLQKTIDAKRDPAIRSQNLTPRRARIAQGMAKDADRLEQMQSLMLSIATAYEDSNWSGFQVLCTPEEYMLICNAKSKADIERLPYGLVPKLVGHVKERPEQKLRRMEEELLGTKIPGFFPTPADTVDRLVDLANINASTKRILEPSAGKGDIADGIRRAGFVGDIVCVEVIARLADICRAKGYNTLQGDILDTTLETNYLVQYDRIIMNPPFEKGQDMEHVTWCFNRLLAPGGRLVSIVGEAAFFREGTKFEAFREFLDQYQAQPSIKLDSAFSGAQSFRQTGVTSRIIVLDKESAWQSISSRSSLTT